MIGTALHPTVEEGQGTIRHSVTPGQRITMEIRTQPAKPGEREHSVIRNYLLIRATWRDLLRMPALNAVNRARGETHQVSKGDR